MRYYKKNADRKEGMNFLFVTGKKHSWLIGYTEGAEVTVYFKHKFLGVKPDSKEYTKVEREDVANVLQALRRDTRDICYGIMRTAALK